MLHNMPLQVNQELEREEAYLGDNIQVTLQQDFVEYDNGSGSRVRFIRVEVSNVRPAIQAIIGAIADISWVDGLVDDMVREGFIARAQPTIDKLTADLTNAVERDAVESAGEYVVSMVARNVIESVYRYRALPLAEVIKEQKSGNPGFDYHHERDELILVFGEAKYQTGRNAYGSAFSQIVNHIKLQKDVKEIPDLMNFMSEGVKAGFARGKRGYSAAFSTSGRLVDSTQLIAGIKANTDFNLLVGHETLLIVAVDMY